MRKLLFMSVFLSLAVLVNAQVIFTTAQSKRIANYTIKAKLDTKKKLISATMHLSWKNTSADTVSELQFHTYMNAFKNTASTFMTESGGQLRGDFIDVDDTDAWGWIEISKITDQSGKNYAAEAKFIQPDDQNENDQTVLSVQLKKAIAPGETAELDFNFETKLPKIFARTGYSEDFFMVGQWFPKIGVYEQGKGWNCHQFHAHSEFFADFGVYDVDITLPKDYIVGATGGLQSEKMNPDSTKTVTYRAEDVIDFAWTASEEFIEKNYNRNGVNIRILLQLEHFKFERRHSDALNAALDYFEKTIGAYPYKNITVVDPPVSASGAGGMEYPTLITAGSFSLMPKGLRLIEMVVVHEFGHQYFMGLLATNEFEEAWLDEGINSYMETRIMDETYGPKAFFDIGGFGAADIEIQRNSYVHSGYAAVAPSYNKAWFFPGGSYGVMTYNKPTTFLSTYENMVGREVMDEILKTYFDNFKFKHPKTADFLKIVKETTQKHHGDSIDTDAFFKQALFGTQTCDYKIESLKSSRLGGYQGWFDTEHSKDYKTGYMEESYRSSVMVLRDGDFVLPTMLRVTFSNGDVKNVLWNGKDKQKEFIFDGKYKVVRAELDPERQNLMDKNFNNNSFVKRGEQAGIWKVVLKIMFFFQNLMQSVAFFA